MKKKWIVRLVCMASITILIALTVKFLKKEDKPKIVVVLQELNTEHSKAIKAGIEKAFADFDIDGRVIAPDSQYPASKQVAMLKAVLEQKTDALIVTPTQPSVSIPVFKEYQKRNIPLLMLNKDAGWKDQTTFIGTDHLKLGKMAGEVLSSILKPGDQVAFIFDTQANLVTNDRIKGAKETLEDAGIEIVTEQQGYDKFGNVKSVMANILQTHPDIKGVFATNDIMALDALRVIEEKGLEIPVIGTEGIAGMLEAVVKGKLSVALAQNPYDMGYLSVGEALKAIKGEHVERRIDSGIDIVTIDNAEWRLSFVEENVLLTQNYRVK